MRLLFSTIFYIILKLYINVYIYKLAMCDQHVADMVRFVVGGLFDVPLLLKPCLSL